MPDLVLASASPRRRQLLTDLGVAFTCSPQDIDENPFKGEKPLPYVRRIAEGKAQSAAQKHKGQVILAADTTVCVGLRILGKPEDAADAERMLKLMSGRRHRVLTAVVLVDAAGNMHTRITNTAVKVRALSKADMARYVADEKNWRGLAGGYGIQTAVGGALVEKIIGSVSGVVGLPLVETLHLLRKGGLDV